MKSNHRNGALVQRDGTPQAVVCFVSRAVRLRLLVRQRHADSETKAGISQFRDARTGSGQHTRARTRSGILQNEHPSNK